MDSTKNKTSLILGKISEWINSLLKYIVIGIFLVIPSGVHADYEVFDLNPIPPNQPIGSVNEYQMAGMVSDPLLSYVIEYQTNETVTAFDRVTIPLCRFGGANGGQIYLEVRSTATSGPIVASSTLAVNSGNIWNTGCNTTIINATTSTFVLNQNVQWLSGGTFYFIFRTVDTTGTFYLSFDVNNGDNGKFLGAGLTPPTWLGQFYYTSMQGFALGVPPVSTYSASSTGVVCGTFDIGCYLSTAFAFLFIPSVSPAEQFAEAPSLASTTPFSYLYQLNGYVTTLRNGTASNTALVIPFNGEDLTVFNTADIESYLGGDTSVVRDTVGYLIWFLALFVAYREVYSIFQKKQDDN